MKTTITAIALAATAGMASAQTIALILDDGVGGAWNEGETRTVTVSASFAGGGNALVAADFSMLHANGGVANAMVSTSATNPNNGNPALNTGTVNAAGNAVVVNALGQSDIFNLNMNNPIELFTYELTAGSAGTLDISVVTGIGFVTLQGFSQTNHTLTTSSFSFEVVPTPGAIAVAGLGGLVATRRRR